MTTATQQHWSGPIDRRQQIGIFGSILLFLGFSAPLYATFKHSLGYSELAWSYLLQEGPYPGRLEGLLIPVLAIASVLLTVRKLYRGLWVTGAVSLAIVVFTFVDLLTKGLVRNWSWGWVVLAVGAGLLLFTAASHDL